MNVKSIVACIFLILCCTIFTKFLNAVIFTHLESRWSQGARAKVLYENESVTYVSKFVQRMRGGLESLRTAKQSYD